MLYSKNGSIPKPETDGTSGWIEVPEPPVAPAGKEVVWWCPPGWVVRDLKPEDTETTTWSWSQTEERWVEYDDPIVISPDSNTITIDTGAAQPTIGIELASAGTVIDLSAATAQTTI